MTDEPLLDTLYTRFLFIRKKIEQEGMTKDLMLKQSELCFAISEILAAQEKEEEPK